jgi:putative nucleotidyltransferase with HDIG domain
MRTLPSRPALSIEIMRELRSTRTSATVVGELISKDVAISAKLIQIANSAFYRGEQPVSNLFDAILLIGLETTAALVLSIETFSQLDKVKPLYFSMDQVWKHSQSVAELARRISQTIGCDAETSATVYTAGLLHDIGKIALALNFEEDFERIPKDAAKKGLSVPRRRRSSLALRTLKPEPTCSPYGYATANCRSLYSWPRIMPLLYPQAQLRAEASQALPKAQRAEKTSPSVNSDPQATLQQSSQSRSPAKLLLWTKLRRINPSARAPVPL